MNPAPQTGQSQSGLSGSAPIAARAIRPEIVGRYELLLELASGGMGAVYLGRQHGAAGFERLIAIKRMHRHLVHDAALSAAFHDEAKIASLIRHPNVVNVVDVYEEDGEHLLVMDYVDGASVSSLQQSARRRGVKLPRAISIRLAIEALRGLAAAHTLTSMQGQPLMVVHRDVSPQNILVGADGGVKLTDFGIARALDRNGRTATGELKGKFRYMSPEQASGRAVDARSDIFSLGVILWELLVGDKMYAGESDLELLKLAAVADVPSPRTHDPSLPVELDAFLMHILRADPAARPSSAAAAADGLDRLSWQLGLVAKPSDIARVVDELVGDRLRSRRALAREILQGRRPREIAEVGPTPGGSSLAGQFAPFGQRRRAGIVALGLGGAVILGLAGSLMIHAASSPAPSRSASASASAKTQPPARDVASDTISVEIVASSPIITVRGAGVANIRFQDQGVTFTLPRASSAVRVEFTSTDGSTTERWLMPDTNIAMRLLAPTASATASARVPPTKGPRPHGLPGRPANLRSKPY